MTPKPRVLHVNKLYAPDIGGVETVVRNLAEGLAGRCEQDVLVCQPRGRAGNDWVNGIRVHRCGSLGTFWSMPVSLSYPIAFRKLVAHADLVHLHHPFPLGELSALALGRRAKVVLTWYSAIVRQKFLARLYRPWLERLLERVEAIIVIYPGAEKSSDLLRKFAHKCHVIPPGIEVSHYDPDDVTRQQSAQIRARYGANLILFAGRLVYYKGLQHLIAAMPGIRGTLLIAGQGPLLEPLTKLRAAMRVTDRVHFLGGLEDGQLRAAFHACDVFVLPSTHPSEAFGLVQLEAMACRKPVVNTSLPTGVPVVSRHGETGLTVEAGNPRALAEAIGRLLRDDGLRRTLGENGRRRVEQEFTVRAMADRTYQLYERVLAR
jgi:glycosyltransferase involved in cell wall biosynthesis